MNVFFLSITENGQEVMLAKKSGVHTRAMRAMRCAWRHRIRATGMKRRTFQESHAGQPRSAQRAV
jgi:hypothetical protein